jgi:hypothetical protein
MLCGAQTKTGQPCRGRATSGGRCSFHKGGSIISRLSAAVDTIKHGAPNKPSPKFEEFLAKHNQPIVKVELARKPLSSKLTTAADFLSRGKFSEKAKQLGYDHVYHNYLLVTTADGKTWRLEKNHVVQEFASKPSDRHGAQIWDIPVTREMTMREMVDNASKASGSVDFWRYRPATQNCQAFTKEMIVSSGLLPADDPKLELQKGKALLSAIPGGEKLLNAVTDTAAIGDRLHQGYGISHAHYLSHRV